MCSKSTPALNASQGPTVNIGKNASGQPDKLQPPDARWQLNSSSMTIDGARMIGARLSGLSVQINRLCGVRRRLYETDTGTSLANGGQPLRSFVCQRHSIAPFPPLGQEAQVEHPCCISWSVAASCLGVPKTPASRPLSQPARSNSRRQKSVGSAEPERLAA